MSSPDLALGAVVGSLLLDVAVTSGSLARWQCELARLAHSWGRAGRVLADSWAS